MKHFLFIVLGCLALTRLSAQEPSPALNEDTTKYEQIFYAVEEMPEFPGEEEELDFYVAEHLQCIPRDGGGQMSGKVRVRFAIDERGQITKLSVLRSTDPRMDAEALRLMAGLPCWAPGIQNGRPVKVWLEYEVRFRCK